MTKTTIVQSEGNRKVRNLQGYISKHSKVFWANNIYLDFKDALNRHMKMHERRGAEREYTCNVCGELVFRNIFPFQAHQRDVHQVGGGKCTKTSTRRAKRQRTDEPGMYTFE